MKYLSVLLLIFSLGCGKDEDEQVELDDESPTINCPEDISVTIEFLDPSPIIEYDEPTVTDNVGAVASLRSGQASGTAFPDGETTVTYRAQDAAGNTTSCSFTVSVVRNEPTTLNEPYVIGGLTVTGKKWSPVTELSDEFEGSEINTDVWDTRSVVPGRFFWYGRWPGLFRKKNIIVQNGELWLTAEILDTPIDSGNVEGWTHGGSIVRSHVDAQIGMFVEAEMKTTETIFSGTFWLTSPSADCNVVPNTELDVTESIGRKSGVFKQPELGWYRNAADEFEFGINSTCRQRGSSCLDPKNSGNSIGDFVPSEDFHVYGMYWRSPTEIDFYLDGTYAYTIEPPIAFENPMAIIMACETYDFNWPTDAESDGFNLSREQRSSRYKWVRTWKLEDE
ncbi:MAG: HYR domain-containing protein [Bacteroidota bacterium]